MTTPIGRPYGIGPYGAAAYGKAVQVAGILGATSLRIKGQVDLQAIANILGAPFVRIEGATMWGLIAPAGPCDAWAPIGTPGCWQARPNLIAAMFPGTVSP